MGTHGETKGGRVNRKKLVIGAAAAATPALGGGGAAIAAQQAAEEEAPLKDGSITAPAGSAARRTRPRAARPPRRRPIPNMSGICPGSPATH